MMGEGMRKNAYQVRNMNSCSKCRFFKKWIYETDWNNIYKQHYNYNKLLIFKSFLLFYGYFYVGQASHFLSPVF